MNLNESNLVISVVFYSVAVHFKFNAARQFMDMKMDTPEADPDNSLNLFPQPRAVYYSRANSPKLFEFTIFAARGTRRRRYWYCTNEEP